MAFCVGYIPLPNGQQWGDQINVMTSFRNEIRNFWCIHIMASIGMNTQRYIVTYMHKYIYTLYTYNNATSRWRHNRRDGVSNHQRLGCLFDSLFWHRSKKISRPRVTGLCEGNRPVTGEFHTQRASNAAPNTFLLTISLVAITIWISINAMLSIP